MQTTNNPFAEISALVLAVLLIVAGAVLLFFGKIGYDNAVFFFLSALGVFGINGAFKAPSPAQQAALLSLASQVLSQQAQPAQLIQAPAPPQGGSVIAPAPTPAPVIQLPFPGATLGAGATMPQAIRTTLNVPAVTPGQVQP